MDRPPVQASALDKLTECQHLDGPQPLLHTTTQTVESKRRLIRNALSLAKAAMNHGGKRKQVGKVGKRGLRGWGSMIVSLQVFRCRFSVRFPGRVR